MASGAIFKTWTLLQFGLGFGVLVCVRKPQDTGFLSHPGAVVEHDKAGSGEPDEAGRVKCLVFRKDLIFLCHINEILEGHIGIPGGLVLVGIQPEVHKKGHIIFHVHIDGIFQGDDRQLLRIRIGGLVDRVIKT